MSSVIRVIDNEGRSWWVSKNFNHALTWFYQNYYIDLIRGSAEITRFSSNEGFQSFEDGRWVFHEDQGDAVETLRNPPGYTYVESVVTVIKNIIDVEPIKWSGPPDLVKKAKQFLKDNGYYNG